MATSRSRSVAPEQSPERGCAADIETLRAELDERTTHHEILAAQRTDLVVDQLWRRLEAADARLATALQQLEDRVRQLECAAAGKSAAPSTNDQPSLPDE